MILILPYPIANMNDMEKYYDEVWYPDELFGAHFKAAIKKRNEWLVDHSDFLIAYVVRTSGGAYECMKKAQQKGVFVVQITDGSGAA